MGILGFSRIGRRVVEHLQLLESLSRLVDDPYADPATVVAAGGTLVSLDELLPRVDVLSLHTPQPPMTDQLIGPPSVSPCPTTPP